LDAAPAGLEKFEGSEPSGCSFFRLAAAGKSFYTVPKNHFNCAVGVFAHNIPLSAEREKETEQTLKTMFDLEYAKRGTCCKNNFAEVSVPFRSSPITEEKRRIGCRTRKAAATKPIVELC
jgi:hypothetical protein